MTVQQAITRLSRLKVTLQNAWQFYRANIDTYEEMAKSIARNVLIALPPPGVEQADWERSVETVMTRIGAFLVATTRMNGFILRLATETMGKGDNTWFNVPGSKSVTVADIVRWVEAGRQGDPDGKRLDDRDFGKSNDQIAFNILYAVRKGMGHGVINYVEQFMGRTSEEATHDRSPQIAAAWIDAIVPRVRADLEEWVRQQVKAA